MGKVLVTGGAGFIGSHLIDRLVGDNQVKSGLDEGLRRYVAYVGSENGRS